MPVRASTYVARREGVPSACVPPVTTSHARRGVARVASTTSSRASVRSSPRTAAVRALRARTVRVAAALAIAASVARVSGAATVWLTPSQPPEASRWTTRSPPATKAWPSVVRAAPGWRCSAARASDTTSARTAAGAPCAVEAVVSGSAAAVAATTASAASPAVLRMDGAFREVGRAPEWARHPPQRAAATAGYARWRSGKVARLRDSADVEEGVEPDGEARVVADGADAREHAGRERDPVEGVVADRQGLPRRPEDDLLVRHEATDAQAVHTDALDVGATRALEAGGRRVGHWGAAGVAAGGGDQLSRAPRGAGRGVGLVGVVQLDDLDRLEERRGLRGEAHHQDRADGEVGGDQHADTRGVGEPGLELVEPGLVEAGRADDGVDAVLDAEAQVVHHDVGVGEVHDHLGARPGELLEVVAGVHRGHQLGVGGPVDGPADLRADLAAGAQHAHPDLCPDLCVVSCAHAANRIGLCVSVCGGG